MLDRTIAVASNNIAWELYELPERTSEEDAVMKLAADSSYTFWLRCGTWINEERALHLVAVVANATGDPSAGLARADVALAIIKANGDRPLDAARLHLARAVSFEAMGDVHGRAASIEAADAIVAKLPDANLRAQFAAERASVLQRFRA